MKSPFNQVHRNLVSKYYKTWFNLSYSRKSVAIPISMVILTDIALVAVAVAVTIGFCVIGVVSTCYCCCFNPLRYLFRSTSFSMRKRENSHNYVSTGYNMVPLSAHDYSDQSNYHKLEPSAPPLVEATMVEGYFVPPLIAINEQHSQPYQSFSTTAAVISPIPSEVHRPEVVEQSQTQFKDIWASVLFFVNIVMLIFFALKSINSIDYNQVSNLNQFSLQWNGIAILGYASLGFAGVAIVLSYSWLFILMKHCDSLIDIVLKANIAISFVSAFFSLLAGGLVLFILFLVGGFVNIWYYFSVQSRIPFASAILSTAVRATTTHFTGIMGTAFSMLLLQLLWLSLWALAGYGIISDPTYFSNHNSSSDGNDLDGTQIGVLFLLILSLYWGIQVIKYLLLTTVAGTIACWWFQPDRKQAVRGSLFRATTTSFGSICFGSLLVAIIQALREMLQTVKNQRKNRRRNRNRSSSESALQDIVSSVAVCLADCILKLLEDVFVYINRFAFCYVAAYGYGFVESGRKVYDLFKQRGWIALINDNLIGNCLSLIIMSVALVMGIFGYIVGTISGPALSASLRTEASSISWIFAVFAACIGAFVSQIFVNVLDSAVAMVFVCYAENPNALKNNHPEAFENLFSWNYMVPIDQFGYVASSADGNEAFVDTGVEQAYEPTYNGQPKRYHGDSYRV